MIKNTNNTDTEIGNKIVSARIIKGLNRKELALKLGITHQQLQKYEKGVNRISASRLLDVAKLLKMDIGYFYASNESTQSLMEEGEAFDMNLAHEIASLTAKIKSKKKIDAVKNLLKSISNDEI